MSKQSTYKYDNFVTFFISCKTDNAFGFSYLGCILIKNELDVVVIFLYYLYCFECLLTPHC